MRAVVFDFDGTLAETREAVSTTVNAVLHAEALPRVHPPIIHGYMGLPLEELLDKLIPRPLKPYDTARLAASYRARFDELGAPKVRPIEGAEAALSWVADRGLGLGIATSRAGPSLATLLDGFGWAGRFGSLASCDRVGRGKPDPALLHLALDELGVAAEDAILVGDTTWDVEMARAAGVFSVAIPEGSHTRERLEGAEPDVILDTLAELVPWMADRS